MNKSLVHNQVADLAKDSIFKGSKSFSLASLFFSKEEQRAVHMLYAWCRFTDDQIDQHVDQDRDRKMQILTELRQDTQRAFDGNPPDHPVYLGLQFVIEKYKIPKAYADELLNGYEMDIENAGYKTEEGLDLYCYRVAGVVGLMMCHIMGLSNVSALEQACKMGMAMQLTNIARDIETDYRMGRMYLPQSWVHEAGIDSRNLLDIAYEQRLHQIAARLVQRAEDYYSLADRGLVSLPIRAALAVAGARWIYSEIGRRVVKRGIVALRERTTVSFLSKIRLLSKGLMIVLAQLPIRLHKPFRRVDIDQVWRLS